MFLIRNNILVVPASFHFTRCAVAPNIANNSNSKLLKANSHSRSSPGSTAVGPTATAAAAKLTDNNSCRDMNSQGTAVIGNLVLYSEAKYSVVSWYLVFKNTFYGCCKNQNSWLYYALSS